MRVSCLSVCTSVSLCVYLCVHVFWCCAQIHIMGNSPSPFHLPRKPVRRRAQRHTKNAWNLHTSRVVWESNPGQSDGEFSHRTQLIDSFKQTIANKFYVSAHTHTQCMCMRTHTHTICARTHTRTRTHKYRRLIPYFICVHTDTHTDTHTHLHAPAKTSMRAYTHSSSSVYTTNIIFLMVLLY